MAKPLKVSQSKVKTWRRCRAAYHYKYVDKLRRKRKSRPLQFGTMVHSMLEAEANADDPFDVLDQINFDNLKLFTAEKEMYGEIVSDIADIMEAYFDYYPQDSLHFIRKNKRSAEHEFEIEIAKDIIFTGKIDAVIKTPKNGLKWLEENKTFGKALPDEDTRWRNLQSAVYFKAVDMMGWFPNLSGIMWNYICSKTPARPQLLKNNKLSTKKISSLPNVVRRTIKEMGFKVSQYQSLMDDAETNQKHYFKRIFTPINKELVEVVFSGFVDTSKEILDYHGKKNDMNIDKHCSWCDYEPLCRAKLTGSDYDFIKEREYTHGTTEEREDKERSE